MTTTQNERGRGADTLTTPTTGADVNTDSGHLVRFLDTVKNRRERLRVDVKEYRGNTYIDIRVWYAAEGGEYRPSSKGIMIKPTLAAELMRGLSLAARSSEQLGAN
ncbi:transcriptional coactivator p15/PC4 family protein [Paraburkholderia sp.]|uniref:transcriptional coactivator p15/PC4 family protein n=1 Tax=Paraburkholderia sp. TaxID=1926495 RepID=UPI0025F2CFFB|nr:transcriptional coactivator p15/PC4 family protein [Paraburkholderia sp.]